MWPVMLEAIETETILRVFGRLNSGRVRSSWSLFVLRGTPGTVIIDRTWGDCRKGSRLEWCSYEEVKTKIPEEEESRKGSTLVAVKLIAAVAPAPTKRTASVSLALFSPAEP